MLPLVCSCRGFFSAGHVENSNGRIATPGEKELVVVCEGDAVGVSRMLQFVQDLVVAHIVDVHEPVFARRGQQLAVRADRIPQMPPRCTSFQCCTSFSRAMFSPARGPSLFREPLPPAFHPSKPA